MFCILWNFRYRFKIIIIKFKSLLQNYVIFFVVLSCSSDLLPPTVELLNFDLNSIWFLSTSSNVILFNYVIKKSSASTNLLKTIFLLEPLKWYIKFSKLTPLWSFSISLTYSIFLLIIVDNTTINWHCFGNF